MSVKLSDHYSIHEFACPCCGNWMADKRLIAALEYLRAKIGRPVIVSSGYRCGPHNAAVGGAQRSKHLVGMAADVRVPGMSPAAIAAIAETIPEFAGGGIGRYETFTHLDVRTDGPARWEG